MKTIVKTHYTRWFEETDISDIPSIGGKNASLGEMIQMLKPKGIRIPEGFALTAEAYWVFLEANHLTDKIQSYLDQFHENKIPLEKAGRSIRRLFLHAHFPEEMEQEIRRSYLELCHRYQKDEVDVAVRSSATAEDLPGSSFAGQQESFLNIVGPEELMDACRKCYASLFTDRAITYREERGFGHMKVALSVGVQKMVRSDKAGAGVMFTLDTESGFRDVILINAAWGLGENVVKGRVIPDEYMVFKPLLDKKDYQPIIEKNIGAKEKKMIYTTGGSHTTNNINTPKAEQERFVLSDADILELAQWGCLIESHYNQPMDIEWAKDGESGELFIVQARPETVQSRKTNGALKTYKLSQMGKRILTGLSIGEAIASGKVCLIKSPEDINQFIDGAILVTEMTDPDWVPIIRRSAGIITEHGGRTCHAAIVSREFGIPAVVGTGNATQILNNGQEVTLSCAEGEKGFVYEGILPFEETELNLKDIPETKTQIMMNIASPAGAFRWWQLPCQGIGLARMEFIINNIIKIHPMALIRFDDLEDEGAKKQIEQITHQYKDKSEYFVDQLALGIGKIAASQYPNPVIVRMSDFKTNEYANLIGGKEFEPHESNPMLGFRGASRYYNNRYREGFALECQAIKRVREKMGLTNVIVMIPFCRTLDEADKVLQELAKNHLNRGENGLQVYVMCEIPSNVILAEEFSKRFDGFSIGSNDLTQLVLGVDRDSSILAQLFDERNPAVKHMIHDLIQKAHRARRKVGLCGQAPSDYPEFAEFLVEEGIDSISLNPDSVVSIKKLVADKEARQKK